MTLHAANRSLATTVLECFREAYGGPNPSVFFAPGRVNLVGAHLDYSGGDVLPLAVDRGVYVAARLRDDRRLRLHSLDVEPAVDVDIGDVGDPAASERDWSAYPLGVWRQFAAATGCRRGADMVFGGDLPLASGLSSSAAIEVAAAVALDRLHGTSLEPDAIAMIAHRAETEHVGLHCGIMDQYASALGRRGHVLLLHCHERRFEHVPLDPESFEVLVMDTRKPRRLAASGFNERVQECAEAHRILRCEVRDLPYLAAYTLADLEAAGDALPGLLRRRARHVVTEMDRIAAGVAGLRRGDVRSLGAALDSSHRSARDDYEVSCDELDVITDAAREAAGVFGARLTGAGFGGCAIALVQPGHADSVIAHARRRYQERFGVESGFEVLHAGAGPRQVGV